MTTSYVEQRGDGYVLTDTRVSLDSIVHAFLTGQSPESIAQAFPVLTLEQVYGAVTFYLAHRDEVDRYLDTRHHAFETAREAARNADPVFHQRLAEAKKTAHFPGGDPHQTDADVNQTAVQEGLQSEQLPTNSSRIRRQHRPRQNVGGTHRLTGRATHPCRASGAPWQTVVGSGCSRGDTVVVPRRAAPSFSVAESSRSRSQGLRRGTTGGTEALRALNPLPQLPWSILKAHRTRRPRVW